MKSSGGMDLMKSCGGMDLEEWELVADDDEEGFLERINIDTSTTSLSHVINYFHYSYCPPPLEFVHKTGPSNQLLLLPPPPPPPPVSIDHLKTMVQPPPPPAGGGGGAWESSIISTLEEEDHDVSSPKCTSDFNQFDHPCKQVVVVVDSEMDKGITAVKEEDDRAEEGGEGGLFKIWKWSINYNKNKIIIDSVRIGGAICSFAAICIMSLSCTRNINNDQTKLHHHFQIYTTTNDHRHKQVVVHRANEALISTGGRIPFIATAARITFGGYYDASASI